MQLSRHLCMVLVYDLLFGKGIQCGGPLKPLLMKHKKCLKKALDSVHATIATRDRECECSELQRLCTAHCCWTTLKLFAGINMSDFLL